mmetsp:Transcript_27023/g.67977  ORF Transcript_27023/g.67977 Transcript_27023/m.67977 type:complete len:351 (-) Transcript_27023:789-1841(-)
MVGMASDRSREVVNGRLRSMRIHECEGGGLNAPLNFAARCLELSLLCPDVLDHVAVLEVGPVGHKVKGPPGGIRAELCLPHMAIRHRRAGRRRVEGHIGGCMRLRMTVPKHATDLVGQPVTHDAHEAEELAEHRNGALPSALRPRVTRVLARGVGVVLHRRTKGASLGPSGGVKWCALVVVAQDGHHVWRREVAPVRRHGDGVCLGLWDETQAGVQLQGGGQQAEHAPDSASHVQRVEGVVARKVPVKGIRSREVEGASLWVPPPLLYRKGVHIARSQVVVPILQVQLPDYHAIGDGGHMRVWNADSSPHGAGVVGAGDDMEEPGLGLVRDTTGFRAEGILGRSGVAAVF